MSARMATPTTDVGVIGVSERDQNRDVATFFTAHPFGGDDESLEKLATETFFRRFLEPSESSGPVEKTSR